MRRLYTSGAIHRYVPVSAVITPDWAFTLATPKSATFTVCNGTNIQLPVLYAQFILFSVFSHTCYILRQREGEGVEQKKHYIRLYTFKKERMKETSYTIFIHQKIGSLQVPMDYVMLVQVVHSFRYINCYFEQGRKFKKTLLLMQVVIHTSTRHKFWKFKRKQSLQWGWQLLCF